MIRTCQALVLFSVLSVGLLTVTVDENPVVLSDGQTLAEVEFEEDGLTLKRCILYDLDDNSEAAKVIEKLRLPYRQINFTDMMYIIQSCRKFVKNDTYMMEPSSNGHNNSITNGTLPSYTEVKWSRWSLWTGIFPGTKWCGMGDIANGYEDLGPRVELDKCCRAHDHCPVKLKAFRAGYGLVNLSLYTKSHCECDHLFYNCLKDVRTRSADVLGNFYFNIMRVECLKQQSVLICTEKKPTANGSTRCIRWKMDPDKSKMAFTEREKRY